jgi:hypothetical protein
MAISKNRPSSLSLFRQHPSAMFAPIEAEDLRI